MKLRLTLLLALLCLPLVLHAQHKREIADRNLYTQSDTLQREGYAYRVNVHYKLDIMLYNTQNKWVNKKHVYKSSGEVFRGYGGVFTSMEPYRIARRIVEETFTTEEAAKLKNKYADKLMICLYIDSFTGEIEDVAFRISALTPFCHVPVEYYREIELELKEHVRFQPTALGMSLNYIFFYWMQLPKGHDGPRSYYGDPDQGDLEVNPLPPLKPVDGDLELVD